MAGPVDSKLVVIGWILLDFSPKPEGPLAPVHGPQSSGVMIQILCGSVLVGFYREEVYSRDWPASYGG